MTARDPGGESRRSGTKVDNYAKFQIRRRFRLTATEAAIHLDVALLADWRDPFWSLEGTITELSKDTGWSRRTLGAAFDVFAAKGLIVIERSFEGGQYGSGLLSIPIYKWLVMVHPSQARSRQSARIPDGQFAPDARPTRAPLAPDSRPTRANQRASRHGIRTNAEGGREGRREK